MSIAGKNLKTITDVLKKKLQERMDIVSKGIENLERK